MYKHLIQGILLHYAATQHDSGVLCSVLTLYKRRDCLPKALLTRNVHQETPLLAALSVQEHCLPNVLILCRACKDMAPGVFVMTDGSGVLLENKTTVHALDSLYCHVDGAILLIIHKCTMLPVYLPTYILLCSLVFI